MDPQKVYLINPSLELVSESAIQPNNPSSILVVDSIANPPGESTPFVTVGQTVRATFTFVIPILGYQKTNQKAFKWYNSTI